MKRLLRQSIYAMAFPRAKALELLSYHANDISEHILKLIVFSKIRQDDVEHWLRYEICNWLEDASDIQSKSKLKAKDYLNTIFSAIGETPQDVKVLLRHFKDKFCYHIDNPYPEFEITSQLIDKIHKIFNQFIHICLPLLLSNTTIRRDAWYEQLKPLFI